MSRSSFADLPADERKAIAQRAGRKSGESRRKRRKLRDELVLMLSEKDTQKALCAALIGAAMQGSVRAFVVIRDTIGEKPVDALKVSGDRLGDLTDDQRDKLAQVYLDELVSGDSSGIGDLLPIEDRTAAAAEYVARFKRDKE